MVFEDSSRNTTVIRGININRSIRDNSYSISMKEFNLNFSSEAIYFIQYISVGEQSPHFHHLKSGKSAFEDDIIALKYVHSLNNRSNVSYDCHVMHIR